MADLIPNISKGAFAQLARLTAANDALIAIPIEAAGVEADSVIRDYDNASVLLAAANNEQTANMTRKTLASVTVTVDDTNDRVDVDAADWTQSAATGNAISDYLVVYDPDTTGGTDADLVPIAWLDAAATPGGGDIVYQVGASGFARAA